MLMKACEFVNTFQDIPIIRRWLYREIDEGRRMHVRRTLGDRLRQLDFLRHVLIHVPCQLVDLSCQTKCRQRIWPTATAKEYW